jgi:L-fuconolactonase
MEMVDAQIHWVDPVVPWSEHFTETQRLEAGAELAIASMDAVGVSAALVNATDEAITSYCERFPGRFGGVPFARFDLAALFGPQPERHEDTPDEYVARLAADPAIVGLRFLWHTKDRIESVARGEYEPYLAAAEHHGLPLFIMAPGQISQIQPALAAHPTLPFIIDHVGLPAPPAVSPSPGLFDALPEVFDLAQYSNVAIKFTGVPSLSMEAYPFEDVWPPMHRLIDAFGVDRLMWGTDFTRCKSMHSYREAVDFLLLTDEVSQVDKQALFSGTIRRWLDWPGEEVAS